jgi:16S rRNA (cytosine1402-N4)-methyltransferase
VDGVLADLGICSDQLDEAGRGFSFGKGGPLDMRMNTELGERASDLLRRLPERELADLIWRYGEERFSRRVARRIVESRNRQPVETTGQLADLVRSCVPRGKAAIDPATRVFQALRIAVNEELDALAGGLAAAVDLLRPGGRLVVLSYHSLEDRIVKRFLAGERRGCTCPPAAPVCVCGRAPRLRLVTRPSSVPTEDEISANPRARSARLRAAERLAA